jgi:hypothetical protein
VRPRQMSRLRELRQLPRVLRDPSGLEYDRTAYVPARLKMRRGCVALVER